MDPQRTKRAPVPRSQRRDDGAPQKARGPRPGPAREEGPQRIAKLLARAGIASRRDIERMIEEGRIALDGKVIDTPATLLADLDGRHRRRQAGQGGRGGAPVPLLQAAGHADRRARPQGPPDDLRPAAPRPAAADAGRPARLS